MMVHYTPEILQQWVNLRSGETKLGELIQCFSPDYDTHPQASSIKYAILGISESVGVKANMGIGGTETSWHSFLVALLNVQVNEFLPSNQLLLMGCIEQAPTIEALDEEVYRQVSEILRRGWHPIVIGGGHNNAYPLLKALSKHIQKPINCINIDPHADIRSTEQRHSGNGFSFAIQDKYLERYALVGLHQSYNNDYIIKQLKDTSVFFPIWWEDIFLEGKYSWVQALQQGIAFIANNHYGVELDLDAIEHTLSSALTPVGISAQQACQALYILSMHHHCSYLHLPEGIKVREDGMQQNTIGKLLCYLVTSYIKGNR